MDFDKPKVLARDFERKTVRYLFNGPDEKANPLNGEYYLRGGVCWPVVLRQGSERSAGGFVLIVGQNLETGKRYIFAETLFSCVDPVVNEKGKIEFQGVATWLNKAWAEWGCRDFYRNQTELVHRIYLMQTIRSQMIEPKPQFIPVEWRDEKEVTPILWRMNAQDQLRYAHADDGGELHKQLRGYEIATVETLEDYPAVYALVCALAGMERMPWRKPRGGE